MSKFPYYIDLRTGKQYHGNWHRFSDGAVTVSINCPDEIDVLQIAIPHCCPANEVANLLRMLLMAKTPYHKYCEIYMPYLPYARADRKFEANSPVGLSVFLNQELYGVLRLIQPNCIICVDAHNEPKLWANMSGELKNKFRLISQAQQLQEYLNTALTDSFNNIDYVVAPDAGAAFKAQEVSTMLGLNSVLMGTKKRDVTTGKILDYNINLNGEDLSGKTVLVVDDICDGGGTFILTAEALPKDCKKILYVTHGIFSKGRSELLKHYEEIHTSFPWDTYV